MAIDWLDLKKLGFFLRRARQEAGYEKAEDFAAAVTNRTGYEVTKQIIYNIESGKQEPKLTLFLAMMRVLHPGRGDCLWPIMRLSALLFLGCRRTSTMVRSVQIFLLMLYRVSEKQKVQATNTGQVSCRKTRRQFWIGRFPQVRPLIPRN